MKKTIIISSVLMSTLTLQAQDFSVDTLSTDYDAHPIESARLQGPREATEEEKAYARQLAREREEQAQIDSNLPLVTENGQAITPTDAYYYPWGFDTWRLHKGLNVNLGASVFANFGDGYGHGAGFSEDVSLMYVKNLSPKLTLAIGGYLNNVTYSGDNYTTAGITALLGYRFDEHWSAYAFVQKAFNSDNIRPGMGYGYYGSPYWGGYGGYWGGHYGMGYAGMGVSPWNARMMDRIGGGVTYQWGKNNQNSISVHVEFDHMPSQRGFGYNARRYDYPVAY